MKSRGRGQLSIELLYPYRRVENSYIKRIAFKMAEGMKKLSEDELYECLKSLNVPTRRSDIKTPTKDFIIRVFECFLKDLQIDIEHPVLRPFNTIKHLEYPDIYEDGQRLILLSMIIDFITNTDNLAIYPRDIIYPKPKRTKKILNYLIVFWRFFLVKYATFQTISEDFNREKAKYDELLGLNKELEEKCNSFLQIIRDECPNKEELISLIASKSEKCKEMEKQKEILLEEYNGVKKKEKDLKARLTSTEVSIVSVKEQIKELDELILSSPDKLSTEIKRIKDSIHEEDLKIRDKENELKEKRKNIDVLKQVVENNSKDLEDLENISNCMNGLDETAKSYLRDFQKYQEEKENVKKLESELQMKEEVHCNHEQNFAKINLKCKKQKETYTKTLQDLQRTLAQEQNDLFCMKATNMELEQRNTDETSSVLELIEKCKKAEITTDEIMAKFDLREEEIITTFKTDCEEIKNLVVKEYASEKL
ncbi:uncharacterized protein CEXT_588401 [Caerostris extrusa]|uniref:Kinetochore protein Nuf2 N-terminal domain-containing protein n=1 Tax=Caerostris extrusa TaxID=172846 RepID=A0AAV4RYJ5_CAEEX|nr:uncharacterized protein CEXT_588401 [Caerostris extrusa]